MNQKLLQFVNHFPHLNVVVLGEAMLDSYFYGLSDRLCREAPVPVVSVTEWETAPGGAANTAANLSKLGANVHFLSVIGKDWEGELLWRALEERGILTENLVTSSTRSTLNKNRVISGSQIMVRFDQGSTESIDSYLETQIIQHLENLWSRCDALIISDYGYGVLTPRIIETVTELQRQQPHLVAVDAKNLRAYREAAVTLVKPNYRECIDLLGIDPLEDRKNRAEQISGWQEEIFHLTGAQIAAVTLDHDGALILERNRPPYRTYARPQPDSHTAGAGDTFLSAFVLALAAKTPLHEAAEIASAAAAIVVSHDGTTALSAKELRGYIASADKYILNPGTMEDRIALYRQQGRKLVFTNGCFDILHRGHISYLNQAKGLGDVLIVGLNDDASVRRLKGNGRPVNTLDDRAQVLSALSCIDHVIPFSEDTPARLIEVIRPDVFVKGGDYTLETLPEAPLVKSLGGVVRILPYLKDTSTTALIDRIWEAYQVPKNGRILFSQ